MSVGAWGSAKEQTLNLEDKSRLILDINENFGCLKTKAEIVNKVNGK